MNIPLIYDSQNVGKNLSTHVFYELPLESTDLNQTPMTCAALNQYENSFDGMMSTTGLPAVIERRSCSWMLSLRFLRQATVSYSSIPGIYWYLWQQNEGYLELDPNNPVENDPLIFGRTWIDCEQNSFHRMQPIYDRFRPVWWMRNTTAYSSA